jgi:hypothetical protein
LVEPHAELRFGKAMQMLLGKKYFIIPESEHSQNSAGVRGVDGL